MDRMRFFAIKQLHLVRTLFSIKNLDIYMTHQPNAEMSSFVTIRII